MKIRYLFEKIFFVVTNTARSLIEYSMIILELLLGYNNLILWGAAPDPAGG